MGLFKSLSTLSVLLLMQFDLSAQMPSKSLFSEVNASQLAARDAQADVISPRSYDEGMGLYNEALKIYKADGEIAEIKTLLKKANIEFIDAIENTRVGQVMFANTIAARNDAHHASAATFSTQSWNDAESKFKDAANELQKGNANNAKARSSDATTLYRKAELESIKNNYLTNAKNLIKKADDEKVNKVAPKTLGEAKKLYNAAEKALVENRYDTDEARYLAKESEYQASLAFHIAKQEKILDKRKFNAENFLLARYELLESIGNNLNVGLRFDDGVIAPVALINEKLLINKAYTKTLENDLYFVRRQNETLTELSKEQQTIQNAMQSELNSDALEAQKRQRNLQSRIDQTADIDAKFAKIERMFNAVEAEVFRQKGDVIIRLIGANFEVGKSLIQQEDYALLNKVQTALSTFENASFIIEGHTDSQGGDEQNIELSLERASAVLNYLTANNNIVKTRFTTVGYGESKPVANNETEFGRTQNRRIDIVIRPAFIDTYIVSK